MKRSIEGGKEERKGDFRLLERIRQTRWLVPKGKGFSIERWRYYWQKEDEKQNGGGLLQN